MKTSLIILVSLFFLCSCSKSIDSSSKNITLPIGTSQPDQYGFMVGAVPIDSWSTFATQTTNSNKTVALNLKLRIQLGFQNETLNRDEYVKIAVSYKSNSTGSRNVWQSSQYVIFRGQHAMEIEVRTDALNGTLIDFYTISSTTSF